MISLRRRALASLALGTAALATDIRTGALWQPGPSELYLVLALTNREFVYHGNPPAPATRNRP